MSQRHTYVWARHSTRVCGFPTPETAWRTLIASAKCEGQADSVLILREGDELILERIDDACRDPSLHCRYE